MALFDQILSDDAPQSDYRGQMLEISSSFASDVAPLFDNPYINTYKTAVSALASAIVLGSIGLIIYKLG